MNSFNNKLANKRIFLLGYGAVGKCFLEMLCSNVKKTNIVVFDMIDLVNKDNRFEYVKMKFHKENLNTLDNYLNSGDILVDLSTNIDVIKTWELCMRKNVNYINTAMEEWEDALEPSSYPKEEEEFYRTSLLSRHDEAEKSPHWKRENSTSSIFEHGMNPGIISHFTKKGLLDAAKYCLANKEWDDLNFESVRKALEERNYPKLAQAMGLHTIHSTESDSQFVDNPPEDSKTKLYNTWSCRGFLTEALVPIQIARGSHEDLSSKEFPRIKEGKLIMSPKPSYNYWARSYIPFEDNFIGALIPHGENYSMSKFLTDKQTGYKPTHAFVYNFNRYAKDFIRNLPKDANIQTCKPKCEVISPMNFKLSGYDKIGSLLIFNRNRGWWTGSIMDEYDASILFRNKFGPTVIQVAAGVYSGLRWMIENPKEGSKWSEDLDSEFILQHSLPYIGRVMSNYVDLTKTHIKDCYKFEGYLTNV